MARSVFLMCFFIIWHAATTICSGLTVELIHRDSPKSPFYNPKRVGSRTNGRRVRFGIKAPQAEIFADNGQYLMKLGLGTPPVDIYALADTGSDLFWTQLSNATSVPPLRPVLPTEESRLQPEGVVHLWDSSVPDPRMPAPRHHFLLDGPGDPEPLQLHVRLCERHIDSGIPFEGDNNPKFRNHKEVLFGCGHNNTPLFEENEMGLIGLGKGTVSLISQMWTQVGARRFSQCLLPFKTDPSIPSKMSLGVGSEVQGPGVVSTPMVHLQDPTYYYVTLNGISVGAKYLPFDSSSVSALSKGNMFLDSGTPPMIIPTDFHNQLMAEVRSQVKLTPIVNPQLGPQLCYGKDVQAQGPILTAHLDGNANLKLTQRSMFIEAKPGIFCFAIVPNNNTIGIYGSFAQSDYLIGFDIDKSTISFKPTDCTKI